MNKHSSSSVILFYFYDDDDDDEYRRDIDKLPLCTDDELQH